MSSQLNSITNTIIAIATSITAITSVTVLFLSELQGDRHIKAINKQTEVMDIERKEKNKQLKEKEYLEKQIKLVQSEIDSILLNTVMHGHLRDKKIRILMKKYEELKIKHKKVLERLELL